MYDWILFNCECPGCTQTKDILVLFLQLPFFVTLGLGNTVPPVASWHSLFNEKIANRMICYDEERGCKVYFQDIWLWYYSKLSKGKWARMTYDTIWYMTDMTQASQGLHCIVHRLTSLTVSGLLSLVFVSPAHNTAYNFICIKLLFIIIHVV